MGSTLFYTAHWRTYTTGTLQFGWIDVTEGQFVVMAVMLVTAAEGFFDVNIWNSPVPGVPFGLTFQTIYLATGIVIAAYHMRNTLPACMTSVKKEGGTIAGTSVHSPLLPLLLLIVPGLTIASTTNVFSTHPLLFCLLFGVIGSKITNRLIVAHMCKGEMAQLDSCLIAPMALLVNHFVGEMVNTKILLLASLVWTTADLLWYFPTL